MSQVDVDSGIENMEVEDSDRREKRNLTEKVNTAYFTFKMSNTFVPSLQLWSFMNRKTFLSRLHLNIDSDFKKHRCMNSDVKTAK